jgi:hypothetical protein
MYPPSEVDPPVDYPPDDDHPVLGQLREHFDGLGLDEATLRRIRSACYGLVTGLDDYVGDLLDTLERTGQADKTRVVYRDSRRVPRGLTPRRFTRSGADPTSTSTTSTDPTSSPTCRPTRTN